MKRVFFIAILSFLYVSPLHSDPGAATDWGRITKFISIQQGTDISAWTNRGNIAMSSAMTPVGDGTYQITMNLQQGATFNYIFFAITGGTPSLVPSGLSLNSTYNDTPPNVAAGTVFFPTSTSAATVVGQSTAYFGNTANGDARRILYVPTGNTTYYVFNNFCHTPNPPSSVWAQPVDTNTIRLTWSYPKDNWNATDMADVVAGGVYYIYYSTTTTGGPYTLITSTPGFSTSYTHSNLSGNVTYFYIITSSDAYKGVTRTGVVTQQGIDDNFAMAFPPFAQTYNRPRGTTPTWFRVDNIDWKKIGGDNALVYLTPWNEDARFYREKVKGRITSVYLP